MSIEIGPPRSLISLECKQHMASIGVIRSLFFGSNNNNNNLLLWQQLEVMSNSFHILYCGFWYLGTNSIEVQMVILDNGFLIRLHGYLSLSTI